MTREYDSPCTSLAEPRSATRKPGRKPDIMDARAGRMITFQYVLARPGGGTFQLLATPHFPPPPTTHRPPMLLPPPCAAPTPILHAVSYLHITRSQRDRRKLPITPITAPAPSLAPTCPRLGIGPGHCVPSTAESDQSVPVRNVAAAAMRWSAIGLFQVIKDHEWTLIGALGITWRATYLK